MSADHGPKKTGNPELDNTALIYYVAPQLTGERPLRDGDSGLIKKITELRTNGKLTEQQIKLLDEIGRFAAIDNDLF